MGWESSDVFRFDFGPLLQGQMRIAMGWESSDVFRFDLGPLLQGQTSIVKLKSAYNLPIIGPRVLQCEPNL